MGFSLFRCSKPILFPAESMILLGSIERAQLQALLSTQLGRPRRLEYLRRCSQKEKKHSDTHSSEENLHKINQEVRFQVSAGVREIVLSYLHKILFSCSKCLSMTVVLFFIRFFDMVDIHLNNLSWNCLNHEILFFFCDKILFYLLCFSLMHSCLLFYLKVV